MLPVLLLRPNLFVFLLLQKWRWTGEATCWCPLSRVVSSSTSLHAWVSRASLTTTGTSPSTSFRPQPKDASLSRKFMRNGSYLKVLGFFFKLTKHCYRLQAERHNFAYQPQPPFHHNELIDLGKIKVKSSVKG